MNETGKKIKELRMQRNMSQFDLELAIDTSAGRISKMENGKINPNKETLFKIIKALDLSVCDAAYLFGIPTKENMKGIVGISTRLSRYLDQKQICDELVNSVAEFFDALCVGVYLWNEEEKSMRTVSLSVEKELLDNFSIDEIGEYVIEEDQEEHRKNYIYRCMNENKIIVEDSIYNLVYPLLDKDIAKHISEFFGLRKFIILPMRYGKKRIGTLGIYWKIEATEGEKALMKVFADIATTSIINATTYSELEKKVNLLENSKK